MISEKHEKSIGYKCSGQQDQMEVNTMETMITISTDNYSRTIDHLGYECTAQNYINGCIINNGTEYFADYIDAEITAKVYADNADPLFDEPISTTTATIREV